MEDIIFLNGKFIKKEEAKVSVLAPGFLYGWGLFETMRSYQNNIIYLNEHLERAKNSCRLITMRFPYSLDKLKEIIKKTVNLNGVLDAYVRLTLWKSQEGTDTLIVAKKYQPYSLQKYKNGFRACICTFRQNENSLFSRIKSTNYLFYRLAYQQGKERGFEEAVILNNRGNITEGSRSNIFFIKDNVIFTPELECGCLDGITRKWVFNCAKKYALKIYEGNFTPLDLYAADEAFFTNSLMGIMPLGSVERHGIVRGAQNLKLTGFFIKKYNLLLRYGN